MNEDLMEDLYSWVDKIPLSRPKKDLKRDFSDGVLIAEVVKNFFPNFVDLHNYPSALGVNNKMTNWKTLNRKVFRKLKFEISEDVIRSVVTCQPNAIQQFLLLLRCKIESLLACQAQQEPSSSPNNQLDLQAEHQSNNTSQHQISFIKPLQQQKPLEFNTHSNAKGEVHDESLQNGDTQMFDSRYNFDELNSSNIPDKLDSLRKILMKKDLSIFSKEETIEILKAKVKKLENLCEMKDARIWELEKKLKT